MARFLALVASLALACTLGLAGCGDKEPPSPEKKTNVEGNASPEGKVSGEEAKKSEKGSE